MVPTAELKPSFFMIKLSACPAINFKMLTRVKEIPM